MKETIYLIDGANYIFRAYYAIGPLSTSKGLPTNAVYGFTQMMLKFLREKKPRYMAVIFDRPEPTFRDEMYADYKATRKEPPDDLVEQFPFFKPLLEAMNIPVMELACFEADDLIGTLAKKFASQGHEVVIVSGDKDLMQMVGEHITIYDSMKERTIAQDEVRQYFGVPPEQVIEVLGLAGDSSDNIPGVPGVGLKTAAKLISQYGSIKNLLSHLEELSSALSEKIRENLDQLDLSKKLATIDTNVPLKFELENLKLSPPDENKLRDFFSKFEFMKLIAEMAPQTAVDRSKYKIVRTAKELGALADKIKKAEAFSFDLETTSLNVFEAEIVGFSVALKAGEAFYIPVGHIDAASAGGQTIPGGLFGKTALMKDQLDIDTVLNTLRPLLKDKKIKKIGQNLKYDLSVLKNRGVEVEGIYCDTMIASYLLAPGSQHGLDMLSQQYLGHNKIKFEDLVGKGKKQKNFSEVSIEKASEYSCEDADVALRLSDIFLPRLKEEKLERVFSELEMPLIFVLIDMEFAGMKIDVDSLKKYSVTLDAKVKSLEKDIYNEAGEEFNVNSPRQLGVIIFEKLKLGIPKRTKTGYSTDIGVLEELASKHDLPKLVLEYRSLSKLKSTYVDSLIELAKKGGGRVHTSFNQTVTATGRLSSSDPNLQNIPVRTEEGRRIREAFIADEGFVLVSADYSQIELRVLAHLCRDESLIDAFKNNQDVHRMTASGIFNVPCEKITNEQRAAGKTINFATIYGQGAYGLSRQLKIEVDEAARYITSYFARYPKVEEYRDKIIAKARKTGFVETLWGRRRYIPDINSKNAIVRQAAERMAFNSVFQGTAADIIKKAMIEIHEQLPKKFPNSRMLMQVHDELLFEAAKTDAKALGEWVKERMESAADLSVPLITDVGTGANWAAAH